MFRSWNAAGKYSCDDAHRAGLHLTSQKASARINEAQRLREDCQDTFAEYT